MVGTETSRTDVHWRPATTFVLGVIADSGARAGCESGTPRGQMGSWRWPGAGCHAWASALLAWTCALNASASAIVVSLQVRAIGAVIPNDRDER